MTAQLLNLAPTTLPALPAPARSLAVPAPAPRSVASRGRTLYLVDIENLVAGQVSTANVQRAWAACRQQLPTAAGDQVRIGCCPQVAATVAFALPSATRQLLIGPSGPDSADRALLDCVDVAFTASQFAHVVIASGDHAFAPLATALTRAGLAVTAITHTQTRFSPRLKMAATSFTRLWCSLERIEIPAGSNKNAPAADLRPLSAPRRQAPAAQR